MSGGYVPGDEAVPGYRLIEFLGRGGFGEVWKASAPGGAQTAIKIIALHGKRGAKEFRALQLVKNIRHPNLVQVTASWLKDAQGRILDERASDTIDLDEGPAAVSVKETIEAESLEQFQRIPTELIIAMGLGDKSLSDRLHECLAKGIEGIPPDELLEYMAEAARAIDFLNSPRHNLGEGPVAIQHRDIKPQNILIVGNAVQVCDFGLARTLSDVTVTQFAGSPAYSPPECLDGNRASPSTDQYSLAVSYVELRTGVLPFDDDSLMGVINAHLQSKLNLSRLLPAEREVIERATSFDPEARFASARDMVQALRQAYEHGTSGANAGGQAKPGKPPKPAGTTSSVITMTMPGTEVPRRVKDTTADRPDSKITTVGDPRGTAAGLAASAPITVLSDVAHRTTLPEGDGAGRRPVHRHWLLGGATAALLAIVAGGLVMYPRGEADTHPSPGGVGDDTVAVDQNNDVPAGNGGAVPAESNQKLLDEVAGMAGEAERRLALDPAKALDHARAARERLTTAPAPVDEDELARRTALSQRISLVEARARWRMGDWAAVAEAIAPLEQAGNDAALKHSNYVFLPALSRFQNARADERNADLVVQVVDALTSAQGVALQPWETDKLREFGDEFVAAVNTRANDLANDGRVTEALDLVTVVRRFRDNGDSRLLQAEFWLAAENAVDAKAALSQLPMRDLDPASQARAAALNASLVLAGKDASIESVRRALDASANEYAAAGFVGPKSALRRVTSDLVTRLATGEKMELAYLDAATTFLDTLSRSQIDAGLSEQVDRARRDLLRKRVVLNVESQEPPDFSIVLADCRELGARPAEGAPVDGLVAAAWTEAAIESGAPVPPGEGIDAAEIEIEDEFAPYLNYVRVLELTHDGQSATGTELSEAIGQLAAGLDAATAPKALLAPFRLQRSAEIVTDWAKQLRRNPSASTRLTAIESPFAGADQAAQVYQRLEPLSKIVESKDAPPVLDTLLALAAWHRQGADPADAQAKTAALIDNDALSAADRLPLLYAYAESHRAEADAGPAARRAALEGYLTLMNALAETGTWSDGDAVEIEQKIVARALALDPAPDGNPESVPPEIAAPLASLYGWRARLLDNHPFADWGEGPALARRRLEALDRAVALDAAHKTIDVARLVDRGRAELALYQPPDAEQQEADDAVRMLDRAEADARAALMADDDDPDASALLAWVQTYRAMHVSGDQPGRVADLMNEAEDLYERAVAASDEGTAKAQHLAGLSNVYVWWINFSTNDPIERREELLTKAVQRASEATKQNPDYENAWRALGNAEEDMGWIIAPKLIPRSDATAEAQNHAWTMANERFANAIAAHRRATLIAPRSAMAHSDLARAMFRSVAEHVHDPSQDHSPDQARQARDLLEESVASFEQAIALDKDTDQYYFFLARALAQLGRYSEANEQFARGLELALTAGRREALIAGEWASVTIAALQSVQPIRSQRSVAAGAAPVLEAAQQCADALEALPPKMVDEIASLGYHDPRKDAIAIRSYVTALEGNINAAVANLDQAIPAEPKGVDIDLLLVRAQCRLAAAKANAKPAEAKALLDKAKADIAAVDKLIDRDPLRSFGTLTQYTSFLDGQARIFYQQWKLAPGDKERGYALLAVSLPIEDKYQLYHPLAWQWRELACDLLIDDITKSGVAAKAAKIAAPREAAQQYLDYALALATEAQDKERLNQLRAELAKAKPAKP